MNLIALMKLIALWTWLINESNNTSDQNGPNNSNKRTLICAFISCNLACKSNAAWVIHHMDSKDY